MNILAKIIIAAFGWGLAAATTEETSTMDNDRIINGTKIEITEVPYHVALEKGGEYICGGSIIAENFVLTADHCVTDVNMTLGKISIRTKSSLSEEGATTIAVKNIIKHPKNQQKEEENKKIQRNFYDVAILELENPICFDEKSRPIKVADEAPSKGEMVELTGWGYTNPEGPISKHLQSINLTITATSEKSFIWAVSPTGSGCHGDSGSPLTLRRDRQVGVVSWGVSECDQNSANKFTNLAFPEIRDFIRRVTGV